MTEVLNELEGALDRSRLVAIVRLSDHTNVLKIVETLCDAGVAFLEITVERPEGFDSLSRAVAEFADRATIGAGTVLSVENVRRVGDLGAQFVVAPNTDSAVIANVGVPYLHALRGPFPHVKFVPTGGVNNENAASWLEAGASAVAMGSSLVPLSGELDGLLARAQQAIKITTRSNA
jgi:2-keto-3-deoxy-6-phosphogluconate aldolase